MKASDLRIGNWVYETRIAGRKIATTIDSIMVDEIPLVNISSNGEHDAEYLIEGTALDDIEPIHLTPEILEKCGFEKTIDIIGKSKTEYIDYRSGGFVLFYLPKGLVEVEFWNKGIETINDRHYIGAWQYLHQLQNLFFSLTNTELTINL